MTGAALSAGSWTAKLTEVSLLLPFPVGEDAIGCEVVRTERILGSVVLHVRFARLPLRAAAHIKRLLDDSQAEFESWQRALADRAGR